MTPRKKLNIETNLRWRDTIWAWYNDLPLDDQEEIIHEAYCKANNIPTPQ